MDAHHFLSKIEARTAVVGVVGLGYVGLPLVLTFARQGFTLIGFDVDETKIKKLLAGESYIQHILPEQIKPFITEKKLIPTTDFARVSDCDALLLCVPTPLTKNREPDMQFIVGTCDSLGPHLKPGQLVVLESTTYPGTTDELVKDILEQKSGLVAGKDFYLAFSPEREDPGNPNFDTQKTPKVLGGFTPTCKEVALALYKQAIAEVVPVSSTRTAEMTKLFENIFRSVNIALANEMKIVCDKMDIDIWEVIAAASTKPFGFMPFFPGPGLGGHCIPIDPFYLTWKAREYEVSTRFIELAGEINTAMPGYVVEKTSMALNQQNKSVKGAKLLILGVAYKRDVGDLRESPALRIIELLNERGAEVSYHDPFIPSLPVTRKYDLEMSSVPLTASTLKQQDAVIIVTNHSAIDYQLVVDHTALVVDTRNATAKIPNKRATIVKA